MALAAIESPDPRATTTDHVSLACEDNLSFMERLPDGQMKLVVTSPPYNLGKDYEAKTSLDDYLETQERVISECVRVLHPQGSICWQVGNYVNNGEIVPLDAVLYPLFRNRGLKLRNRIVWHFGHGLHSTRRLSGRYETINWWTKNDDYTWNLGPNQGSVEVSIQAPLQGSEHRQALRKSEGKEPERCMGIPECQEQPP